MAGTTNSRRAVLADIRLELDKQRERARQSKPASTRESELVLSQERGVHAGLWLEKYIADLQRENDYSHADLVAGVASLGIPPIYEKHFERWQTYLREIHAETREFRVKKRMAVGLGDKGVLETSIALHHTYGVPYIPGSALKGLAASYARLIAGEEWQQGREPYRVVFGDTENAGFLTFFDALYVPCSGGGQPLRPDVITVHHPEYYKGAPVAPADWDSPTPIPFLSATGCYLLALAAPDLNKSALWIGRVFELLEQALLVLGIGAKTSSGYGRMERRDGPAEPEVLTEEDKRELQLISEYLQKIQEMHVSQITSQIKSIGNKCLTLKSVVARQRLARAIIEKARQTGKEDELKNQPWYRRLLEFSK